MEVFNIKKFSLHDGPGIRTTFFLRGCPLNCTWCHNPESFRKLTKNKSCEATKFANYDTNKIVEIARLDLPFYEESGGGVTFSGGEPTLQHEELIETLLKLRDEDIHTAIDTSGFCESSIFRKIVDAADLILFDLKIYDSLLHKKYTGVDNLRIIDNFFSLSESKSNVFVRIPLIPDITDTEVNLHALKGIISRNTSVKRLDLLPYNELANSKYKRLNIDSTIESLKTQTEDQLVRIKNIFGDLPIQITLRG